MKRSVNRIINGVFSYLPKRIRDVFYYRFLFAADFPEIVHVENTNACNARCIMCPREKMTRDTGFMGFDLFKKIADECATFNQFRTLHLHGYGECLMEKDFFRKVSYAKDKGIKETYIVTNGSLLTEAVSQGLICSGLDKMKISFYGATESTYEAVHLNLRFKEVEENVLRFIDIRKKLKRNNPSLLLQFLPLEENVSEKGLFRQKWGKVIDPDKGDALSEFRLHNYGLGKNYHSVKAQTQRKACSLPFNTMQILWNGDVVPCCYDFNGAMVLGNIKDQSLYDIWNSDNFINLRQAHRKLDFKRAPLCGRCDQILVDKNENIVH